MPRVPSHDPDTAPVASRDALKQLEAAKGKRLNIFSEMAHSPALLNAYAALEGALAEHGTLTEADKQAIRLAVAGAQNCRYCQSAYTLAAKAAGLTEEQTVELRGGTASFDDALDALVRFAREAFDAHGHVAETTWQRAIDAGWRDDQLLEAFANAARTFLTSGFNHLVGTELDLPPAPGLQR
jgi:AhpD family alkylhydroperoxidase